MSKKFIVEIPTPSLSANGIRDRILAAGYVGEGLNITVTELQPLPEVKKVRTGIFKTTNEITGFNGLNFVFYEDAYSQYYHKNIGKRVPIDNNPYPDSWYENIETTWDFSSIPVGSLIRADIDSCWMIGYYMDIDSGYLKVAHGNMKSETTGMHTKQIKSIRIIELPKV